MFMALLNDFTPPILRPHYSTLVRSEICFEIMCSVVFDDQAEACIDPKTLLHVQTNQEKASTGD